MTVDKKMLHKKRTKTRSKRHFSVANRGIFVRQDEFSFRALIVLIRDNDHEELRQQLQELRMDHRDDNGTTLLMIAADRNRIDCVRVLLEENLDPNTPDLDDWTALTYAAR